MNAPDPALGWSGIVRLGLVQASLAAVVVLVTSTLNRVMVVEYAMPAMLPGFLVALHYAVQMVRPKFGHGSDVGGRRTPWILGGMVVLGAGGIACAVATVSLAAHPALALAGAVAAYATVGLGVGAAGTSLLVLMAQRVNDRRRAAAATIVWIMMIAGLAITSKLASLFLQPFTPQRLVLVLAVTALAAVTVATLAVRGIEGPGPGVTRVPGNRDGARLGPALRELWREPQARHFTIFVFVSMLAYSAQELILEPFAGLVFAYTPAQSAALSSLLHQGVLLGMIAVALACSGRGRVGSLRTWAVGGCIASSCGMVGLAAATVAGPAWPLRISVFSLGLAIGSFTVAAIGSMMELAHQSRDGRAGLRMGLWGAAQALAFALGGLFGASIVDAFRHLFGSPSLAFGVVFGAEAALFLVAAGFAATTANSRNRGQTSNSTAVTV
jgi:BCD family chlorophyll transporter-like MFS transporter